MYFALLQPFRFLAKALGDQSTPKQMAWGFAIGVAIGLVPKGNLLAIVLMTVLGAARVNLGFGMAAAFLFSWIGVLIDPLSHRIGLALLTWKPLVPLWTWAYNQPVLPWTSFYNTVVLGSFLVGLALIYPTYRLTKPLFARYAPRVAERARKWWITKVLWGTELGGKLGTA